MAEQRDAEPDEHYAGVLDGRVAEEATEIVLRERVGDPGQSADAADDQQRVTAPGGERPEDLKLKAPEPVEPGAQRDRQRGRTQPRGGAVAGGQAALERYQPDFCGEAGEEQREQHTARAGRERRVGPGLEREAVGVGVEQRERGEQSRATELRETAGEVAG